MFVCKQPTEVHIQSSKEITFSHFNDPLYSLNWMNETKNNLQELKWRPDWAAPVLKWPAQNTQYKNKQQFNIFISLIYLFMEETKPNQELFLLEPWGEDRQTNLIHWCISSSYQVERIINTGFILATNVYPSVRLVLLSEQRVSVSLVNPLNEAAPTAASAWTGRGAAN